MMGFARSDARVRFQLPKGRTMPPYTFEIRWADGEKTSWTDLPTDDSARRYGRLLAQDFKTDDQYRGSAQLVVKNSEGAPIALIEF
jgi:hypothetical protein